MLETGYNGTVILQSKHRSILTLSLTVLLVFSGSTFSQAAETKCEKNFYGFDKTSAVSKKCAQDNLKNIKWPIGSTGLCKDGSFSFSKNKKSMCLKGKGVGKYRS
jgi:hypothetical protein